MANLLKVFQIGNGAKLHASRNPLLHTPQRPACGSGRSRNPSDYNINPQFMGFVEFVNRPQACSKCVTLVKKTSVYQDAILLNGRHRITETSRYLYKRACRLVRIANHVRKVNSSKTYRQIFGESLEQTMDINRIPRRIQAAARQSVIQ